MSWRIVQSFRMWPQVQKALDEIPYGAKSDLINEAIAEKLNLEKQPPKAEAMKQNPELPQNPQIQQHQSLESADSKTPSEQAATSAKKPLSRSLRQRNTLEQLSTALHLEALTRNLQNKPSNDKSKNIPTKKP